MAYAPPEKKSISSNVAPISGTSPQGGKTGRLIVAALLFCGLTALAVRQPYADPPVGFRPASLAWWANPIDLDSDRRLPTVEADLYDVFALADGDRALVWAVGNLGLIVHSADSGRTWAKQEPSVPGPSQPPPATAARSWFRIPSVHAAEGPALAVYVVTDQGDPVRGATVVMGLLTRAPRLQPGSIIAKGSTDGYGFVELPVSEPGTYVLEAESPLGRASGTATVGPKAPNRVTLAINTTASARQPQEQTTRPPQTSPDADKLPQPQPEATSAGGRGAHFRWVQFEDRETGWALAANGGALGTRDGGSTWLEAPGARRSRVRGLEGKPSAFRQPSGAQYRRVIAESDARAWAIRDGSLVELDRNGARAIALDGAGQAADFWTDGATFVVVGAGGQAWRGPQSSLTAVDTGTAADLHGVYFLPGTERGWAVGADGLILRSDDGGLTWRRQTRGELQASPPSAWAAIVPPLAPWWFLSLIPLGLLLAPTLQRETVQAEEPSVADKGVSDRPIEAGDPDPLQLGVVARGLSRFLRNDRTEPPLTVAVTGAWGAGKSSLMNLVKFDLESFGFRPVWFNAWHHQHDDNLLASLLQNIRLQGVPPIWHPQGWFFRVRLYSLRGWRSWWPVLALGLLATFSAGYFFQVRGNHWAEAWTLLETVFGLLDESGDVPVRDSGSLVTFLVATVSGLLAANRKLSAFGASPGALIAKAESGGAKALEAKAGFRYEYARELRAVTQALDIYRLTIFVDDLDRCESKKVVEVLEAINFLVSSGDCYVIMGLDRRYVESAVGLSFEEVATEMAAADAKEGDGRAQRAKFARNYLEKLVNVEVAVPAPDEKQSLALLAEKPPSEEEEQAAARRENLAAWSSVLKKTVLAFAGIALLAGFYWFGGAVHELAQEHEQAERPEQIQPVAAPTTPSDQPPADPAPEPLEEAVDVTGQAPELRPPPPPAPFERAVRHWPVLFVLLILIGCIHYALTRRIDRVEKDSPEFNKALRIWHPLVNAKLLTPRAVKRYLNRVRYLAMRQRPDAPAPSRLELFLERIGLRKPHPAPASTPPDRIPESALVALSALNTYGPTDELAHRCKANHIAEFGAALNTHQAAYDRLASTVRTN